MSPCAARTAIGTFGGSLSGTSPIDRATVAARAALERSGVEPGQIGTTVFGHVINAEPRDMYLSRVAAMQADVPKTVPAMNVNRPCGSGVQATVSGAQAPMPGDADSALALVAECMSPAPFILPGARCGAKIGDIAALDMMLGALNCPLGTGHMGVTAEAIAAGRFSGQIVPVTVRRMREELAFDIDEHPKIATAAALAGLRAVFRKNGTVTAGNASGINDGPAALVLARADAAERGGLRPRARPLGYTHAVVRPDIMGLGATPAVRLLLE